MSAALSPMVKKAATGGSALPDKPTCAAILLAAGSSERFGAGNKLSADLGGKAVWRWSFDTLSSHPAIDGVCVACSAELEAELAGAGPALLVRGGATRQASCRNALQAIAGQCEIVLVHDAARPFASHQLIDRLLAGLAEADGCFPALKPVDTVRLCLGTEMQTFSREEVLLAQTPQAANLEKLSRAYRLADHGATDDMTLLQEAGGSVRAVDGEQNNFKITTAADLARARALVDGASEVRIGFGYDVHRFSPDPARPLLLGGVKFEGYPGLDGHSDADVLAHAVVDALLGAAALGDIGQYFPPTDERWRNASSAIFLSEAARLVRTNGWHIVNLDATVIAERPMIGARRDEIRASLSKALAVEVARISVKATTNEQLGSLGRGEGIAAQCVATIRRANL